MQITTMGKLFIHDLSAIYDAELRFHEAQGLMLAQATNQMLKDALTAHRVQTGQHIQNLERVFALLGEAPIRRDNPAAAGLIEAGNLAAQAAEESPAHRDCAIAAAVAQVEHFEIASYRALIAETEAFQRGDLTTILRQSLAQEEQTAQKIEQVFPSLLEYAVSSQRLSSALGSDYPILS